MQEYETLVTTLVDMARISRPQGLNPRQTNIQNGICDLLEDAAVAIDDLMNRIKQNENRNDTAFAHAA